MVKAAGAGAGGGGLKKRPASSVLHAEGGRTAVRLRKRPAGAHVKTLKVRQGACHTVHLIDALPYFFRAYFALPSSIKDPAGRTSNGVVGFANFLLGYLRDEAPTHIALCWDRSLTTSFRNSLYPAYKANRELPPPELSAQIQRCRQLSEALGLACFDDARYEADDLIATLAAPLVAAGHRCTVVTSDKDLCQLVGPRLVVHDYAKDERYDAQGVRRRLGVRPEQVPDYLGLAGDAVDNIPGVKGLGPKTATALLAKFRDLEAIYAGLGSVSRLQMRGAEGVAARLAEQRDMAFLSRRLATVARDAPVRRRSLGALRRRLPKRRDLGAVLEDLGLARLRERVDSLPRPLPQKR